MHRCSSSCLRTPQGQLPLRSDLLGIAELSCLCPHCVSSRATSQHPPRCPVSQHPSHWHRDPSLAPHVPWADHHATTRTHHCQATILAPEPLYPKSCRQSCTAAGRAQDAPQSSPSFPAGLIPKLVEHRSRTEPPYSPLSPLDLEAVSFQPSPEPSPYILSRLDKFAADLQVRGQGQGFWG